PLSPQIWPWMEAGRGDRLPPRRERNGHSGPKPDSCHKGRNARRASATNDETKKLGDEIRVKQARGTVISSNDGCSSAPRPPKTPVLSEPRFPERGFRFLGFMQAWAHLNHGTHGLSGYAGHSGEDGGEAARGYRVADRG